MKFCGMNGPSESEVESLLKSPCWGSTQNGSQDQYLLDGHKLLLEHDLDYLPSDAEQKTSLDVLDNLLMNSSPLNASSDQKPLPPFTNYTGHLSINGISGHHYHAIAQRLPDESNNNYMQSAYHQANSTTTGTGVTGATNIHLSAVTTGTSPLPSINVGGGGSATNNNSNGLHNNNNHNNHNNNHNNNNNNNNNNSCTADHNIVSSSTCLPESVLSTDSNACLSDVKLFEDSQIDDKLYSNVADSCVMTQPSGSNGNNGLVVDQQSSGVVPDSVHTGVRIYTEAKELSEYVELHTIDDIAAIIGSAIADTTVSNQLEKEDGTDTRDSWMDLESWIDCNCIQSDTAKLVISQQDSLSDFILPHSPVHSSNSTLQSLLTHGYMPLLQNRLQNGPPNTNNGLVGGSLKGSEVPSSTSYCNEMPSNVASSSASPPGSVVSTTADNLMINPRYLTNNHAQHQQHQQLQQNQQQQQQQQQQHQQQQQQQQQQTQQQQQQQQQQQYQVSMSSASSSMKSSSDGICSPDLLGNYPHTTTITPTGTPKAKRSRSQKKSSQQQQQQQQPHTGAVGPTAQQLSSISPTSVSFNANDLSGLLGKEKPVHRCSICNRGFLNKSNIKVHLRTHTGEKPFRCDVCAKAFRQKAHLLKHQQIHKRIGRD